MSIQVKVLPDLNTKDIQIAVSGYEFNPDGRDVIFSNMQNALNAYLNAMGFQYWNLQSRWLPGEPEGVHVNMNPVALKHDVFDNSQDDEPAKFKSDLSDSVSTSTTVGWSASVTAGISFTVGVEVGFAGNKASASTSYSMSATVGHDQSHTETVDVGSTTGVDADVGAHETDLAVLLVERGNLVGRIPISSRYVGGIEYFYQNEEHTIWIGDLSLQPVGNKLPDGKFYPQPNLYTYGLRQPLQHIDTVWMDVQRKFVGEDYSRIATIPNDKPSTIYSTIDKMVSQMKNNGQGFYEGPVKMRALAPSAA